MRQIKVAMSGRLGSAIIYHFCTVKAVGMTVPAIAA